MKLILEVRSYCGQPVSQPNTRSFTQFPVYIGRSASCDYVLHDANMYVSSNHASITHEGGSLILHDTSQNGTYVNESTSSIGQHNSIELGTDNVISIGEYSLWIGLDPVQNADASVSTDDYKESIRKQAQPASNNEDPFEDSNEDWTPPSVGGWMDDEEGNDFNDAGPPEQDYAHVHSGSATFDSEDSDWIPGLDSESTTFNNEIPDQRLTDSRNHERALNQVDRKSVSADRAHVHRPVAASGTTDGLSAFLSGARVDSNLVSASDEALLMEHVGEMLHIMVDGMMQLLDSRAELKNTWRSDVTRLGGTDNNPLKFSHNASEALNRLLATDTPGYQPLERAVNEAVNDLKLHQVAMMDGMKSAVKAILLQFEPEKLSAKLKTDRPITANIPLKREAELWELFCEQYEDIRTEAIDDFGELFNREFRKAYEARMARVCRQQDF